MEFHEKLQVLRKQKGLTQEQLAAHLFVSRTAISKWESGRGYPNIDSLQTIAKYFGITVDELLSGDALSAGTAEDSENSRRKVQDLIFGTLDCSAASFFFLPFFGQKAEGLIQSISLISLTGTAGYVKAAYWIVLLGIILSGLFMLALQNCHQTFWLRYKHILSLAANAIGVLLFILTLQPYPAILLLLSLTVKIIILTKKH